MVGWATNGVRERARTEWSKSDPDVVCAARGGCERSFEILYSGLSRKVRRLAVGILRDAHAAEDMVQETFLAVHQGLPGLDDPQAFDGWVLRIARHKAISASRRRAWCTPSSRVYDDDSHLADGGPGVLHRTGAAEPGPLTVLLLRAAYANLSHDTRETLRLKYRDGLSCQAIARVQRVSLGCVKTRLHRGRRHLYSALDRRPR